MKKHFMAAGLIVTLAIVCITNTVAGAADQSNNAKARLDGYQEVPAVSTTGTGTLDLRIDDNAQTIEYELTYGNLEGVAFASHIHLGAVATNGGVSAFLCGGGGQAACPPSGTVTGVITPAQVIGPAGQGIAPGEFDELVRAIRAGVTYANVHTNKHPGGEIRGQIR